jgi:putative ABC transport system permease protein
VNPNKVTPPALAQRLLVRFLRHDLAEEVLGDLEEKFYETLKTKSVSKVRLNYWYQVIHYLRPFAIRKLKSTQLNTLDMLRNYFKIGWRNLSRQKLYSSIKIGGLALGIAACFLISLYIRDELSYDLHYANGHRIYRVVGVFEDNGQVFQDIWFPAPFAKALREDYPEIENVGRFNASELFGAGSAQIRRADRTENSYEERFTFMDQALIDIFQFPMVYGSMKHALAEPKSIVITKRKADKYFPNEDPVGKQFIINNDLENPYTIGGVIEDFPANSHLQYDFIMTLSNREFWPGEQTWWRASNYPTYILLNPGVDPNQLQAKVTEGTINKYFLPAMIEGGAVNAEEMAKKAHLEFQPVSDIHLDSEISDGLLHGDKRFIWLFGGIAAFILIIAGINFINLSTAKSANRAKEVGLRKVVGSLRGHLVNQFLTESVLFSTLSVIVGVLLAAVLLPYFNTLSNKSLSFPWTESWLIPVSLGGAIVVGLLAGLYPSFYLSGFRPIQVLKGNLARGSKSSRTQSMLVVFQFTISIVLIAGTIVIYRQMEFILNTKIGFDKEQVLVIQGSNTLEDKIVTFKEELQRLPQVKHATISDYLPIWGTKRNGNGFWKEGKIREEREINGQMWIVDEDYIKTMGINLVAGRDFLGRLTSDSLGVIVNQAMVKKLGLEDPIGKVITNGDSRTILGVVEDFHFETMKESIDPLAMRLGISPGMVSVKIQSKDMSEAIAAISKIWKQFAPHQPIRYSFLDESYARMYEDVQRTGRIFTSFAVLAISVACLGLFALSAFMVEQRSKEISIRLVLGASLNSIFNLLTKNFLFLVLISFVIAIPVAWYIMQKWLQDYAYKVTIGWDVFAIAGVLAVTITLFTVS